MKKLILAAFLAACGAGSAFAQTSQGSIAIWGNFGLNSQTSDAQFESPDSYTNKGSGFSISLHPDVGYFISNNLEAGAGIRLIYSRNKSNSTQSDILYKSYNYEVGLSPYLRKYVEIAPNLMLHGTGFVRAGIGKYKSETEPGTTQGEAKSHRFAIGAYPGLTYFVTPKFGINTSFGLLSYERMKHKPEGGTESVTKDLGLNLSLSSTTFGISYFISR